MRRSRGISMHSQYRGLRAGDASHLSNVNSPETLMPSPTTPTVPVVQTVPSAPPVNNSRHKYLFVVGTVLLVDVCFLVPYSAIQVVSFLHVSSLLHDPNESMAVRWILQVGDIVYVYVNIMVSYLIDTHRCARRMSADMLFSNA
jgi:hypothetical protein